MLYDLPVTDSTSSHDEVSRQIKEQFTFYALSLIFFEQYSQTFFLFCSHSLIFHFLPCPFLVFLSLSNSAMSISVSYLL